ncbi:arylamine N-acetyltransferase [Nocardia ninae]|uniref:Arylamine N-acetyltransferase n=1 Tax=Nocardia ninae NBRC 108245 TaxID=1210091 RepID=A0A511MD57_9NOCA|nr:arylamine N-acetyltransferase [Nocardia ninae]GEM38077.1 arylamine N-acetyltransferase [Nocardia ninae NBRC 108245]
MREIDASEFLRRLALPGAEPPSVAALTRLHEAFVQQVPYEALEIQLGRSTTLDPLDSADRIIRQRRGGYCYHLNGAFSALLRALGYQVTLHRAGVQNSGGPAEISRNHLALTVSGLPNDPETTWLVDAGLGDALFSPLPLRAGDYRQGPFTFGLRPSTAVAGGWRFDHDPRGSFVGMDFDPTPATMSDFAERHQYLSTAPESGFVRVCVVQRRHASGGDTLRARTLSRIDDSHTSTTVLDTQEDWFTALHEVFGISPAVFDRAARHRLWHQVTTQHEAHLSRQT